MERASRSYWTLSTCALLLCTVALLNSPLSAQEKRSDALGDALPQQAQFRIGTKGFLHNGTTFEVGLSPDGKTLVTWGSQSLNAWDSETGRLKWQAYVGQMVATIYGTRAMAFSGNEWLYTQSDPNELLRWNMANGKYTKISAKHSLELLAENRPASALPGYVRSVDVSSDGSRIAAGGGHGVVVYNAKGEVLLEIANRPDSAVDPEDWQVDPWLYGGHYSSAIFSPDQTQLAVVRSQSPTTLDLFDAATGKERMTLAVQDRIVRSAFSPDSKHVVVTQRDGAVTQFSSESGQQEWSVRDERFRLVRTANSSVAYSHDGSRLFVAAGDVYAIDARDGHVLNAFPSSPTGVRSIVLSPDSKILYAVTNQAAVERWDVEKVERMGPPRGVHASSLLATAMRSTRFVFADQQGRVHLRDAAGDPEVDLALHLDTGGRIVHLAMDRDGHQIAVAKYAAKAMSVTLHAGETKRELAIGAWEPVGDPELAAYPEQSVVAFEFSPDGKRLAIALAGQGNVQLWNTETAERLRTIDHPQLRCATFDRTGERLITGAEDLMRFWKCDTGEMLLQHEVVGGTLQKVRCSPDSDAIITAHFPNVIRVWDGGTMQIRKRTPLSGEMRFEALEFSSDGRWLATGMSENIVVIDAMTGKIAWKIPTDSSARITSIGFSCNDQLVLSATQHGSAYAWRMTPDDLQGMVSFKEIWSNLHDGSGNDKTELMWRLVQLGDPAVDEVIRRLEKIEQVINLPAVVGGIDAATAARRTRLIMMYCEKDERADLLSRVGYAIQFLCMTRSNRAAEAIKRLAADHPSEAMRAQARAALLQLNPSKTD